MHAVGVVLRTNVLTSCSVEKDLDHVLHVRPNMNLTKREPYGPENVGRQRDIFWPVQVFLWRVATFENFLGATRHSL